MYYLCALQHVTTYNKWLKFLWTAARMAEIHQSESQKS